MAAKLVKISRILTNFAAKSQSIMTQPTYERSAFDPGPSGKARGVAGLLAIFLGTLGVQYFYCGRTTAGLLAILISLVSCGAVSVLWLVQGIMMIAMPQSEFERKFVNTDATFPLF